jgi:hypothetical protein
LRKEDMAKSDTYDSSWDREGNEDAWNTKHAEWKGRDWGKWLSEHLSFPFMSDRTEDPDDDALTIREDKYFGIGHSMKVLSINQEDETHGIIVKAREGRRIGYVPLCELEVTPRKNKNYWPVREYVVWFANR